MYLVTENLAEGNKYNDVANLKQNFRNQTIFNLPGHFLQRFPFLNFLQHFFFPQYICSEEKFAAARGAILKGTIPEFIQQIYQFYLE